MKYRQQNWASLRQTVKVESGKIYITRCFFKLLNMKGGVSYTPVSLIVGYHYSGICYSLPILFTHSSKWVCKKKEFRPYHSMRYNNRENLRTLARMIQVQTLRHHKHFGANFYVQISSFKMYRSVCGNKKKMININFHVHVNHYVHIACYDGWVIFGFVGVYIHVLA